MFKIITLCITVILLLISITLMIILLGVIGHFMMKFIIYAMDKIIGIVEKWNYCEIEGGQYFV